MGEFVKVKTTRFDEIVVEECDIISFQEGIFGFEHLKKYFIVDPGDNTLVLWLQSIDDCAVAFPIIEPKIFHPNYTLKLLPSELSSLNLESVNNAKIFCILTIPEDVTEMSANLKAPLVVNHESKAGKQIVLQDNKLSVKYSMYKELKKYIVGYASDDQKRTLVKSVKSQETRTSKRPEDLRPS